jgi:membrane protein implicated in regulation of membrane protease activity
VNTILQKIGGGIGTALAVTLGLLLAALPLAIGTVGAAVAAGLVVDFIGGGLWVGAPLFVAFNLFLGLYVYPPVKDRLDGAVKSLLHDGKSN